MFGKLCFFVAFLTYCSARTVVVNSAPSSSSSASAQQNVREGKSLLPDSKLSFLSDLSQVVRVYEECNAKELTPCLKMKFITALDRLSRKVELPITDQIALVKDEKADSSNEIDNEVLEATLPRSLDEKETKLDEIIAEKLVNFFSTRSFQFKLSGVKDMQRSLQEEGRKKNKYGSLMMIPLMMGGSMIPMALGTLALLAGKALIIAKLALVLSLIIGLKKLLTNDDHASSYQVVSHGGGHYRRSLQDDELAQSMAYRAYIPLTPETSTSQYSS